MNLPVFLFVLSCITPIYTHQGHTSDASCEIYVSNSGQDTQTCGASTSPCKTLSHALNFNQNGPCTNYSLTEVILKEGTYYGAGFTDIVFKDSTRQITISSERWFLICFRFNNKSSGNPKNTIVDAKSASRLFSCKIAHRWVLTKVQSWKRW